MNKTLSSRGLIACLSLVALASCQDYDGGFSLDTIKKAEYAKHFENTFGTPDPNQDWSMATLVKANVNLPGLTGTAKMNICTGDPRNSETRLLAQIMLQDGKGSIDFDAIKGSENVFVTVEQDGEYKVFSQYNVINGFLGIGDVQMPLSRAGVGNVTEVLSFSTSCPTTQRTGTNATAEYTYFDNIRSTTEIDGIKYPSTDSYENSNNVKSLEDWIVYAKGSGIVTYDQYNKTITNNSPFTDESICAFVKVEPNDFSTAVLKDANFAEDNHDGTITMYWDTNGKTGNPNWKDAKSISDWKQDAINNYNGIVAGTYKGPWTNESLKTCFNLTPCTKGEDGAMFVLTDESTWVLKSNAQPRYLFVHPTFQYLNGVEQAASPSINYGTFNSFFGDGNFFAEGVSVWEDTKLGVYYDEATMRKMENGFSIVTTANQVIELPYVFGCTAYSNQFGYIYYKESEEANIDPISLKHYVLIEDGRPSQNVYRDSWKGTAVASNGNNNATDGYYTYSFTDENGNPSFSGNYITLNGEKDNPFVCTCNEAGHTGIYSDEHKHLSTCYSPADRYAQIAAKSFYGTTYRPMFFGEDGKASQGTYNWPAGYKIVFWINTLDTSDQPEKLTNHPSDCFTKSGGMGGHFNYSLPTINKRLYHNYQGSLTHTEEELKTLGQVQCISWTIDGTTFLAFGDVSTDKDLNDMVFMVSAPNSDPENTVVAVPVKWHLNYNNQHEENDLFDNYTLNQGANYTNPKKSNGTNSEPSRVGYTFIGWSTAPTASTGEKTINGIVPTTSTDAIHYYALWVPVGKSYTITWHKNYDPTIYTNDCGKDDPETDAADIHKQQIVGENETFSKPSTDPTAPSEKRFKGWSLAPTGDILSESWFENLANMTATGEDENICFYAIYEDAPSPGSDPEPISWIFACEDLGGSFDYDFNDVVWEVKYAAGTTKVEVRLLAAGGTLPFTLNFNGQKVYTKEEAFGSSTKVEINPNPTAWKEFAVANTWSLWDNRQEFVVAVEGNSGTSYISAYSKNDTQGATNTRTPEVIILPATWRWPLESVKISIAYPSFTTWVSNNNYVQWPTPTEDTTVTR